MDFNTFIFPAPASSYVQDDYQPDLMFIPRRDNPIVPVKD